MLKKRLDILFVHIAILGAPLPSLDILRYVILLKYFVSVMKKLRLLWIVCLVLVIVQRCVWLACGNSHIEHKVARILPSLFSWPQVEPTNLLLFLGIVLLQSLGATHCSTFIVPWATCFCALVMLLNKLWIKDLVGGTSCNVVMVHNYSECLSASRAIIYNIVIAYHCIAMR